MAVLVCFRDARGVGAVLVAVIHGPTVHARDVAWHAPIAVVVHLVFLQALSALSAHKEHHVVSVQEQHETGDIVRLCETRTLRDSEREREGGERRERREERAKLPEI